MTRADLHSAYARAIEMCEGAGVNPWACVKFDGEVYLSGLSFEREPERYQFALCIVEGKPVFEGDELWFKGGDANGVKLKAQRVIAGCLCDDERIRIQLPDECGVWACTMDYLTWTPQPADPYEPFREALKSGDKWVQDVFNNGDFEDVVHGSMLYGEIMGTLSPSNFSFSLKIVDKLVSWKVSHPTENLVVKITYNRETRQVKAEVLDGQ